jgi:peroxiredoxin
MTQIKTVTLKMSFVLMTLVIFALTLSGCQGNQTATTSLQATPDVTEASSVVEVEEVTTSDVREGFLPGTRAYDFELVSIEGETIRLSDYRGKTVVLNFFASWCPPCQVEMPHLNDVYLEFLDQDVVVIGVNLTQQDKRSDLDALLAEHNIAFPILLDEKSEVASRYAIRSIPVNVIINPEGIVTDYAIGAVDSTRLIALLEKAMPKKGD